MALFDNLLFRGIPQLGDTTVHNEDGAEVMAGTATVSAVDVGGTPAWQIGDGVLEALIGDTVVSGTTPGSGCTIAFMIEFDAFPGSGFEPVIGYSDTTAVATNGPYIGMSGSNALRARYLSQGTVALGARSTATQYTFVLRAAMNDPAESPVGDYVSVWENNPGRVGADADFLSSVFTESGRTLNRLIIDATGASTGYKLFGLAVWGRELADAEAAVVANDFLGQMDPVTGPVPSDVDGDDTVFEGQTSVQINGSGFGATQGTGSVTVSPTDDINDVNAVNPTVSTWSDTQITLSAVNFPTGVAEGGTAYVFVTDDAAASNAAGHAITRLDITAPLLSAGTATGVTANAATPEVATNEAAGQAWMVLVPSAESTPSAAQIKAGQNAASGSPVASGTVNPVSGTAIAFSEVTGLTPSTGYKIAFVQDDAATPTPNESNVTTHTFNTAALPTITTEALKQNNGTVIASQSGIVANVYNPGTGALVVRKTGLASDGSGILSFSDAAMAAATEYLVHIEYDAGGGVMADGVARLTTA